MTERLRASVKSPLMVDRTVTSRFVAGLLAGPLGWVKVIDGPDGLTGFLAASVGTASISMAPIAIEHGWWAEQGGGVNLLRRYLHWSKEMNCFAARMSTPVHNEEAAQILRAFGFCPAEQAWVKVI